MDKTYFLFLILFTISFHFGVGYAQQKGIGINTTSPRTTLEVAGSAKFSELEVTEIPNVQDGEKNTFLIQDGDNAIKSLDASDPESTALAYLQIYELSNPDGDYIKDYNTLVPVEDYDMVAVSASFNANVDAGVGRYFFAIPYVAAFKQNGTWHLTADYPGYKSTASGRKWTITTLIYSKTFSKDLGTIEVPMGNTTVNQAATPIID